jgi:hypothetical protein
MEVSEADVGVDVGVEVEQALEIKFMSRKKKRTNE